MHIKTFQTKQAYEHELKIYSILENLTPKILQTNPRTLTIKTQSYGRTLQELLPDRGLEKEVEHLLERVRFKLHGVELPDYDWDELSKYLPLTVPYPADWVSSHGDFHSENILVAEDFKVIDFEFTSYQPKEIDYVKFWFDYSANIQHRERAYDLMNKESLNVVRAALHAKLIKRFENYDAKGREESQKEKLLIGARTFLESWNFQKNHFQ